MDTSELYKLFIASAGVCIDSRSAVTNQLFFAIKGENFDGNKYAELALEKCKLAIVDDANVVKDERFVLVDNVLEELQGLAAYHRKELDLPIIAITGTNGKTTTKELVASVMSKKYNVAYTKGNFNNHIGVPLTLLGFNSDHEFGIVEMGANHIGEISTLCKIVSPNFGLITNVGKAHLEGFGSFEGVKNAKSELYGYLRKNSGTAFVNYDNEILDEMNPPHSVIYYGKGGFTHCQGRVIDSQSLFLSMEWLVSNKSNDSKVNWSDHGVLIKTNLVGNYNFENALAAICIGNNFGVAKEDIVNAIVEYIPSNNRSQVLSTQKNQIVLDGYNANPTSMNVAIRNFAEVNNSNKILILGDMFELGRNSIAEHGVVVGLVREFDFEQVIFVGSQFYDLKDDYSMFFKDVDELSSYLTHEALENKTILLKGSRGMKLERIVDLL